MPEVIAQEKRATFTPGPWVSDWDDNGFFYIHPIGAYLRGCPGDDAEASAHLIAAAPEMYDALRYLTAEVAGIVGIEEPALRQLLGNTNITCLKQRFLEARAALTKAEGHND